VICEIVQRKKKKICEIVQRKKKKICEIVVSGMDWPHHLVLLVFSTGGKA
jgi:hypothetical protein